ncbi:unnamed protein product [Caenorhabditis auriculariae]|uniref:Galectin n=1 Tax=Caenorhabditis auriculariae TaxID=2777116 RepID=A0A8S1H3A3_9PELO|nr:unnamed protein product [Caenorhabditis auriculariae]
MKVLLVFIGLLPLARGFCFICLDWNNVTEGRQYFSLVKPLKPGDVIIINGVGRWNNTIKHFIFDLYEGIQTPTSVGEVISLRVISNLDTNMMAFNTYTKGGANFKESPKLSPVKRETPFQLRILVREGDYQIFFDDQLFWTYTFRLPFLNTVKSIGFEGMKFPRKADCPKVFGTLEESDSQTIVVENQNVYAVYTSPTQILSTAG